MGEPPRPSPGPGSNPDDRRGSEIERELRIVEEPTPGKAVTPEERAHRQQARQRLKAELEDLYEHAGYDTIEAVHVQDDPAAAYDPERNITGVREIRQVRSARRTLRSNGMSFVIGLVIGAIGLGATALVGAQTDFGERRSVLIFAGVAFAGLLCGLWAYRCYRRWLHQKTYLYRLLQSLGEDVSAWHSSGRLRHVPMASDEKGARKG